MALNSELSSQALWSPIISSPWVAMARLILTVSGGTRATRSTMRKHSSRRSSLGTTLLTRPMRSASAASTWSPVRA